MVGNSVRSDVLPVLALGGRAVHIPYHVTWALEEAEHDVGPDFPVLRSFAELPQCIEELAALDAKDEPDASRAHPRVVQHPMGPRTEQPGVPALRHSSEVGRVGKRGVRKCTIRGTPDTI